LPLIFSSWRLPYKTPVGVTKNAWTPFSTAQLLHLSNVLMELFATFIGEGFQVFRKKIRMGMKKIKFQ
jgi:hypothetical protein